MDEVNAALDADAEMLAGYKTPPDGFHAKHAKFLNLKRGFWGTLCHYALKIVWWTILPLSVFLGLAAPLAVWLANSAEAKNTVEQGDGVTTDQEEEARRMQQNGPQVRRKERKRERGRGRRGERDREGGREGERVRESRLCSALTLASKTLAPIWTLRMPIPFLPSSPREKKRPALPDACFQAAGRRPNSAYADAFPSSPREIKSLLDRSFRSTCSCLSAEETRCRLLNDHSLCAVFGV